MATVSLDSFLSELSPHVTGCPNPLITHALVTAATDFCTRTLVWQERLAAVAVTKLSFPYTIPAAAHATPVKVLTAQAGDVILTPTSYAALDTSHDWDTAEGAPYGFLITPHRYYRQLRLYQTHPHYPLASYRQRTEPRSQTRTWRRHLGWCRL